MAIVPATDVSVCSGLCVRPGFFLTAPCIHVHVLAGPSQPDPHVCIMVMHNYI